MTGMAFAAAPSIPFTVNLSEAVNVDTTGGTPRIAVTVDGLTRYATFTSGSGTSSLVFTYTATAGDLDLDGVALSSPIDLNGGTIKDLNGNDATLTFTVPDTSNVKVNYPSLSMDFTSDADGRYTLNGNIYNDLSSFLSAAGGSFSRGSVATYYDSTGTLQTASAGTPRFDYDPATFIAKGILIEESRTNNFLYSEQLNSWLMGGGISVTANTSESPDGTFTAETVTKGASLAHSFIRRNLGLASNTWTLSVYAKYTNYQYLGLRLADATRTDGIAGSSHAVFNLTSKTFSNLGTHYIKSGYQELSDGWIRVWVSATTPSTYAGFGLVQSDGTEHWDSSANGTISVLLWGAQVETGAFPTSYIPTTGSIQTRVADSFYLPITGWYNDTEGAFFTQTQSPLASGTLDTTSSIYTTTTASLNSGVFLRYRGLSNNFTQGMSIPANNNTITADVGTVSSGVNKTAQGIQTNNYALYANGVQVNTDNACTLQTGITYLYFSGSQPNVLQARGVTNYEKFKYYPLRPTNAQLQLLTQ